MSRAFHNSAADAFPVLPIALAQPCALMLEAASEATLNYWELWWATILEPSSPCDPHEPECQLEIPQPVASCCEPELFA